MRSDECSGSKPDWYARWQLPQASV
jgi:hypothetical protein